MNTVIHLRYDDERQLIGGSKLKCKKGKNPLEEYKKRVSEVLGELNNSSDAEDRQQN